MKHVLKKCAGLWLVALLALLAVPSLGKLMAIDLGGNLLKVSVVQPGRKPISIAENEMSKRQTPVMVGFVNDQRVLGEDAVTVSARHPDKFIEHLRDLIGRRADEPAVQKVLDDNFRQYDVVPDPERGTVQIRIPGNEHLFSVEELMVRVQLILWVKRCESMVVTTRPHVLVLPFLHLGPHRSPPACARRRTVHSRAHAYHPQPALHIMRPLRKLHPSKLSRVPQASELSYAHQMAVANTGMPALSAVIIVPPYFSPSQRQAMLDAAEIAKLDVLALVHSHAAAALQYGIERDFAGGSDTQVRSRSSPHCCIGWPVVCCAATRSTSARRSSVLRACRTQVACMRTIAGVTCSGSAGKSRSACRASPRGLRPA